jgi:hypothetical protein
VVEKERREREREGGRERERERERMLAVTTEPLRDLGGKVNKTNGWKDKGRQDTNTKRQRKHRRKKTKGNRDTKRQRKARNTKIKRP